MVNKKEDLQHFTAKIRTKTSRFFYLVTKNFSVNISVRGSVNFIRLDGKIM